MTLIEAQPRFEADQSIMYPLEQQVGDQWCFVAPETVDPVSSTYTYTPKPDLTSWTP